MGETAYCTYAVLLTKTCGDYSLCLSQTSSSYMDTKAKVAVAEAARKEEYVTAKQFLCYLSVLSATEADKPAVLETCVNMFVNISFLTINYPEPPSAEPCDSTPADEQPCHVNFLTTYYHDKAWPTEVPADTCHALVHGWQRPRQYQQRLLPRKLPLQLPWQLRRQPAR